jgi:hypothetical protein
MTPAPRRSRFWPVLIGFFLLFGLNTLAFPPEPTSQRNTVAFAPVPSSAPARNASAPETGVTLDAYVAEQGFFFRWYPLLYLGLIGYFIYIYSGRRPAEPQRAVRSGPVARGQRTPRPAINAAASGHRTSRPAAAAAGPRRFWHRPMSDAMAFYCACAAAITAWVMYTSLFGGNLDGYSFYERLRLLLAGYLMAAMMLPFLFMLSIIPRGLVGLLKLKRGTSDLIVGTTLGAIMAIASVMNPEIASKNGLPGGLAVLVGGFVGGWCFWRCQGYPDMSPSMRAKLDRIYAGLRNPWSLLPASFRFGVGLSKGRS